MKSNSYYMRLWLENMQLEGTLIVLFNNINI